MNLFNRIFGKPHVECPRCLGKGIVDWEDIRRLNKLLKWIPGECAYCNGYGKVTAKKLSKVTVDNTYLTTSLTAFEKLKLESGDKQTLKKAEEYELFLNHLIGYVEHKYAVDHLDAESIADSYLTTEQESQKFTLNRDDLIDYIKKVIDLKNSEMN